MQNKKTGLPPGTLVYLGEERTEKTKISVISFNEKEYIEKDFYELEESLLHSQPDMVKWINIDGIHNTSLIDKIGKFFDIHPLTLEDIVNPQQRPKFENYDNYVVSIMKMVYYDKEVNSEQLCIVLTDNLVISFQETKAGDAFDLVRNHIRQGKGRVRKLGADYLFYCLIDAVVDRYFSILEKIDDRIEELEEELTKNPSQKILTRLHHLKREIIFLRKTVWPLRELINNIERSESPLIKEGTLLYFRDVYDHSIRIIDAVETFRDLLSGMTDIYLSSTSNRLNEVMKLLTIISTIFIPVTFIAGVWGMNFKYMPELQSKWGYALAWGIMLTLMGTMVVFFRRKKWL